MAQTEVTQGTTAKKGGLRWFILFVGALILFTPGTWLGLPSEFASETDSPAPLGPLRFVAIRGSSNSEIHYPAGGYLVFLPLQAVAMAWYKATGDLGGVSSEYPFGFSNPVTAISGLTLSARLTSVLFAAACVTCLAYFLFRWYGRLQTLWIVIGVGTTAVFCYYARSANTDMPQFFFWTAGFLLLHEAIRRDFHHSQRLLLFSAVFVALAASTKDQAIALAVGTILVVPILAPAHTRVRAATEYALVLGACYALFAIFPDPGRWFAHLRHVESAGESLLQLGPGSHVKEATLRGQVSLLGSILKMVWKTATPTVASLSVLGLVYLLTRKDWRSLFALAMPVLAYHLIFFARVRVAHERYVLLYLPILAVLAAEGSQALHRYTSRHKLRFAPNFLFFFTVLWALLMEYGPITHAMIYSTRDNLRHFLKQNVGRSATIEWRGTNVAFPPATVYDNYDLWIPPEYRESFNNQRFHFHVDTSGPPPEWILSEHSLINPPDLRLQITNAVPQDLLLPTEIKEIAVLKLCPFLESRSSVYEDAERAETFRVSPRYHLYQRIPDKSSVEQKDPPMISNQDLE